MIQRIDSITNFGIFKNYSWSGSPGMQDFKEKNILYGWNYSGKTTLSRIFSCLRDQTLHHDFPSGLFKLTSDQGSIDQSSLGSFPYKVAVFNAEYAKENLRWEYDEHINAIFFEVGDNAKITAQIEKLSLLIEGINGSSTVKGKKDKFQAAIDEYNRFETLYTQEAGRIKNDSFVSLIEFNKSHLRKIKDKVLTDLESHIIINKDELLTISKTVKVEEPKPPIEAVSFQTTFQQIVQAANEALLKVPSRSQVIAILDKNTSAYEWVKTGIGLHTKNDNCFFCGNEIGENRYKELVRYFENESSQLKLKITEVLKLIATEISMVDEFNMPSSINDFNDGFQEEFQKREATIIKESMKYNAILNKIGAALKKKSTEKIYSKIVGGFQETAVKPLLDSIERLQDLISKNNDSLIILRKR
ncbi:wobble nucleotide-excising tRNase [Mucilaginibacter sp. UYP25]